MKGLQHTQLIPLKGIVSVLVRMKQIFAYVVTRVIDAVIVHVDMNSGSGCHGWHYVNRCDYCS